MVLFAMGTVGCALTIPIVAVRFFSVLFEKDEEGETPNVGPAPVPRRS
jgi:hypothetical protein